MITVSSDFEVVTKRRGPYRRGQTRVVSGLHRRMMVVSIVLDLLGHVALRPQGQHRMGNPLTADPWLVRGLTNRRGA